MDIGTMAQNVASVVLITVKNTSAQDIDAFLTVIYTSNRVDCQAGISCCLLLRSHNSRACISKQGP